MAVPGRPPLEALGGDIDTNALLDLEQAVEESSGRRWGLLMQVISNLKTQLSEVNVSVAEGNRRIAKLEEQSLRERSVREAAEAALRAESRDIAESIKEGLRQTKSEALASVERSSASLTAALQAAEDSQRRALDAEREARCEALSAEIAARHRRDDEALQSRVEIRRELQEERKARESEAAKVASAITSHEHHFQADSTDRAALEARLQSLSTARYAELQQVFGRLSTDLGSLRESHEEVRGQVATVSSQIATVTSQVAAFKSTLEDGPTVLDEKLSALEASMAPRLEALVAEERLAREAGDKLCINKVEGVAADLAREKAERKSQEELLPGKLSTLESSIKIQLESATAALRDERASEVSARALEQRLEAVVSQAASAFALAVRSSEGFDTLRLACSELQEAVKKGLGSELDSREALAAALQAEVSEVRGLAVTGLEARLSDTKDLRGWTQHLVAQLRADVEEFITALRTHSEGLHAASLAAVEVTRKDLSQEVSRLDSANLQLQRTTASNAEQVQSEALKVKAVLDAHGELAEALEVELRRLGRSLEEKIAAEAGKLDKQGSRLQASELDLAKIRAHLPILFAPSAAFGGR